MSYVFRFVTCSLRGFSYCDRDVGCTSIVRRMSASFGVPCACTGGVLRRISACGGVHLIALAVTILVSSLPLFVEELPPTTV